MIVAQGGSIGGWSLYAKDGALTYCYNYFGIDHAVITAETPLPAGTHQVRMEFAYDGGGVGKGGTVTLYVDGQQVGDGAGGGARIPMRLLGRRDLRRGTGVSARRSRRTTVRGTTPSAAR